MDKLLKVKDIQKILGCGQQTVYDLVKLKDFPKITLGKRYYIPEEAFNKWINDNVTATIMLHK